MPAPRPRRRTVRVHLLAAACAALLALASLGAGPAAADTTALEVSAVAPPQRVFASDGREHLVYNLIVTNAFTADAKLTSVVVRGGGKTLANLSGKSLAALTRPLASEEPTTSVPKSSAVVIYVDVALPRSAGRSAPKTLSHRISYTLPPNAPIKEIIGSRTIDGPKLRVEPRPPIKIAPPLLGSGWLNANGCCNPAMNHRSTMLAANGRFVSPETFAIDYIQIENGRFYSGDGTRNSDWYGFGDPIYAVGGGTVVSVVNDRPDIQPFTSQADNHTVNTPEQFGGNGVVIKLRPGVYAHYYHMVMGSVTVEVGQRVRTGQVLGMLGNSGNTQGAHLHFGLTDGPGALDSKSLPFEIDRFRYEGIAAAGARPGELKLTGKAHDERLAHPLVTAVSAYTR